eukprot:scaffold3079_cov187-Ochromonas_danica.AAC.16
MDGRFNMHDLRHQHSPSFNANLTILKSISKRRNGGYLNEEEGDSIQGASPAIVPANRRGPKTKTILEESSNSRTNSKVPPDCKQLAKFRRRYDINFTNLHGEAGGYSRVDHTPEIEAL